MTMGEEKKIEVEEVDGVDTPPRARVTAETPAETFGRKRDYLAGFLAEQKPEPEKGSGQPMEPRGVRYRVVGRAGDGSTVAAQGPKPMRARPGRWHHARSVTVSPSCKNVRVSPPGSEMGTLPPCVSSMSEPPCPASGPDCVPLPSRSPGRRLQPLLLWCATSWASVQ